MDIVKLGRKKRYDNAKDKVKKWRSTHAKKIANTDAVIAKKGELYNAWKVSGLKHVLMPLKMKSEEAMPLKRPALIVLYTRLKDEGWERIKFHLVVDTAIAIIKEDDDVANKDNTSDVDELLDEAEV